ncbi:hypothetical protein V1521DRAFT_438684 [Lipomyces starkeyi]
MRSGWPQLSSWSRYCCPAFLFKSLLLCGLLFPASFPPSLCKDSSIIKRATVRSGQKGGVSVGFTVVNGVEMEVRPPLAFCIGKG